MSGFYSFVWPYIICYRFPRAKSAKRVADLMGLQSKVRRSTVMLRVLCKCDGDEMLVYGVSLWQGGKVLNSCVGWYVETQESVCFSSALFPCILHMYSHRHVYIFGTNLVFLFMMMQLLTAFTQLYSRCVREERQI